MAAPVSDKKNLVKELTDLGKAKGNITNQDILNAIAPNLLGVIATMGIFYFLRKGTPVYKIIIALFIIGFACYFLGSL